MKFLLDSCVAVGVARALERAGHNVDRVALWELDPGDKRILQIATEEERILITRDKGFGRLTIMHGEPHRGLLRLGPMTTVQQTEVCLRVVAEMGESLSRAIVVAYPEKHRVRWSEPD